MTTHNNNSHSDTVYGTVTGTILTLFAGIDAGDLFKTAILATIGATVSFVVSLLLKLGAKKVKLR